MPSSTYYFKDIKTAPILLLKRFLSDREVSVKTKNEIWAELKRRNSSAES